MQERIARDDEFKEKLNKAEARRTKYMAEEVERGAQLEEERREEMQRKAARTTINEPSSSSWENPYAKRPGPRGGETESRINRRTRTYKKISGI